MSEVSETRRPGLPARIMALRARHRTLDRDVALEQSRPQPDAARLQALKRQRLRLKEDLRRHERGIFGGSGEGPGPDRPAA